MAFAEIFALGVMPEADGLASLGFVQNEGFFLVNEEARLADLLFAVPRDTHVRNNLHRFLPAILVHQLNQNVQSKVLKSVLDPPTFSKVDVTSSFIRFVETTAPF